MYTNMTVATLVFAADGQTACNDVVFIQMMAYNIPKEV